MKSKSIINKRSILLGVLVVLLGLAVYLNWQLSQTEGEQSVTDVLSGSTMGQAMYVNADPSETQEQADDYFTKTRADREKARKEAVEALNEIINHVKSDGEAVADATARSNKIASAIETESNMEALIRAKGFADCVVIMGEDNVSIVVKSDGLLASDTVQLQEIAEQNSGFSLEKIKIIEVK